MLAILICLLEIVKPESSTCILQFNNEERIEYSPIALVICGSGYIAKQAKQHVETNGVVKHLISMDCSYQAFNVMVQLIDEEQKTRWENFCEEERFEPLKEALERLDCYDYSTSVLQRIARNIVLNVLPLLHQPGTYYTIDDVFGVQLYKSLLTTSPALIGMITTLYLKEQKMDVRVVGDTLVVCKVHCASTLTEWVPYGCTLNKLKIQSGLAGCTLYEKCRVENGVDRAMLLSGLFDSLLNISTLDMSGCKITWAHFEQLKSMRHLKTLVLRKCGTFPLLGNTSCSFPETLECLDISETNMDEAICGLLRANTKLKKLIMERCTLEQNTGLDFLKNMTELEELIISDNILSKNHLDVIYNHDNIKALTMNGCILDKEYLFKANTESLQALTQDNYCATVNGQIVTISLSNASKASREELAQLSKYNGKLIFFDDSSQLKLKQSAIMKGVQSMLFTQSKNGGKEKVKPMNLNVFNDGRIYFYEEKISIVLLKNVALLGNFKRDFCSGQKLRFCGNMMVNFLDDIEVDGFMNNVEELSCEWSSLSAKQAEMIISSGKFKKLSMKGCGLDSKLILSVKSGKDGKRLEELNLANNHLADKSCLSHLVTNFPNLTKLNLSNCKMQLPSNLERVPKLKRLVDLNVRGNLVPGELCKYIFDHEALINLNVDNCGITGNNLAGIEKLNNLKELYAGNNPLYEGGVDGIIALNELTLLSIPNISAYNGETGVHNAADISKINNLSKLTTLDISNNVLGMASINKVFMITSLNALIARGCNVIEGDESWCNVVKLINLRKLDLGRSNVSQETLNLLPKLPNLSELDLIGVNVPNSRCRCHTNHVRNLAKPNFQSDLCAYTITSYNYGFLTQIKSLQELRMCTHVDPVALDVILLMLPSVKALYLSGSIAKTLLRSLECFPGFNCLELLALVVDDAADGCVTVGRLSKYESSMIEIIHSCPEDRLRGEHA